VRIRAWRYLLRGRPGHGLPVYFLDTRLAENSAWDRALTGYLYGGDERYRLCQEADRPHSITQASSLTAMWPPN
jgi:starch phosphorylase